MSEEEVKNNQEQDYSTLTNEQVEKMIDSKCKKTCESEETCCQIDKNDKFYRFKLDLQYGEQLLEKKQYFKVMTTVLHHNSINCENIYNKYHEQMELLRENAIIGLLDVGEYEKFEEFYKQQLDFAMENQSEDLYKYFYNFGEYLVYTEKYEEAIQMYQACQEIIEKQKNFENRNETLALLLTVLAFLFLCIEEFEEGLEYCKKAEKLSTKCYFIEYQRTNIYLEMQNYEKAGLNLLIWAKKAYEAIGVLDESMKDAMLKIMENLKCKGNVREFMKIYENEIQLWGNLDKNLDVVEYLLSWGDSEINKESLEIVEKLIEKQILEQQNQE